MAWCHMKPGGVIGEGVTSIAVGAGGLKASWREVETWHHMVG